MGSTVTGYEGEAVCPSFNRARRLVSIDRLSLYHNCDSTAMRLRYDYDEKLTCSSFACVELEEGARYTS